MHYDTHRKRGWDKRLDRTERPIAQIVLTALERKPLTVEQLAHALALDSRLILRVLDSLRDHGKVLKLDHVTGKGEWQINDAGLPNTKLGAVVQGSRGGVERGSSPLAGMGSTLSNVI